MSDLTVYKYENTNPKEHSDTELRRLALQEAQDRTGVSGWKVRAVDWNVQVLLGYKKDKDGKDQLDKPILANHCYVWLQRGTLGYE